MASPYQQQALRRKLIYLGLIVALFTVAGVFRVWVVEAKGKELSIREQDLGEVELGSSALQLSLTGSRVRGLRAVVFRHGGPEKEPLE